MTDYKERRKPGRPKKNNKEKIEQKGVIQNPINDKNVIEFLYDEPSDFKHICSYLKSTAVNYIEFNFTSTNLILYAKNYRGSNFIKINVNCKKVNRYYCEKDMTFYVLFNNLELIFQKLDKSYESISFLIVKNEENKYLKIILTNDNDMPEYFSVDIVNEIDEKSICNNFNFDDIKDNYSLEFKLPCKQFRKIINDTKNFSNEIFIEQCYTNGKLMLKYSSFNKQVKAYITPNKNMIINSKIKNDELFCVSILISNLKAISNSILSSWLIFKVFKDKPLWITVNINNNTILIDTLIEIVNYKSINEN